MFFFAKEAAQELRAPFPTMGAEMIPEISS
jgi:hypothetical protein